MLCLFGSGGDGSVSVVFACVPSRATRGRRQGPAKVPASCLARLSRSIVELAHSTVGAWRQMGDNSILHSE
jgi:hypothetical protein